MCASVSHSGEHRLWRAQAMVGSVEGNDPRLTDVSVRVRVSRQSLQSRSSLWSTLWLTISTSLHQHIIASQTESQFTKLSQYYVSKKWIQPLVISEVLVIPMIPYTTCMRFNRALRRPQHVIVVDSDRTDRFQWTLVPHASAAQVSHLPTPFPTDQCTALPTGRSQLTHSTMLCSLDHSHFGLFQWLDNWC